MTTPYPTNLPHGTSGLSHAQAAQLYKAPFTEHLRNLPKLGAKTPRQILNSGNLWYGGVAPCGDFTGTAAGGSGGPAVLAYGPTGQYSIVGAGKVTDTGTSTSFRTSFPLSDSDPTVDPILGTDLRYSVALLRMTRARYAFTGASWNPTTRRLTFAAPISGYEDQGPTGDDWVWITAAGTGGVTGWYRVDPEGTIANTYVSPFPGIADEVVLTADATILNATTQSGTVNGYVFKSDQAGHSKLAVVWNGANRYISGFGIFGTSASARIFQTAYTAAAGDVVEVIGGGGVRTFSKVSGNVSNHPLAGVNVDTIQVADAGLATDRPVVSALWDEDGSPVNRLILTGAYTTYTWTDGDLFLIESVNGNPAHAAAGSYHRITARIDANTITLGGSAAAALVDNDLVTGRIGDLRVIVWKNPVFQHLPLTAAAPWTNTVNPGGLDYSTVSIDAGSPAGYTIQQGDYYYVYVSSATSAAIWPGGTKPVVQESDPEHVPTPTAASSLYCSWPYLALTRHHAYFMKSNGGVAASIAAPIGSQINHAWHGQFQLAPETFMQGDWVQLQMVADAGWMGTPYFIEVMVAFDFDPEDPNYWRKDVALDVSGARLGYPVVWFHSPVITRPSINPLNILLFGKASSDQTIGAFMNSDTVSMQWSCRFDLGGPGGDGSVLPPTGFPAQLGPISKVLQPRLYRHVAPVGFEGFQRWWLDHTRWTVLIKAEHPSMRGIPGHHGHFPGQPFNMDTGNGRHLLGCWGTNASIPPTANTAPWGPRFRVGSFDVLWGPGGNF